LYDGQGRDASQQPKQNKLTFGQVPRHGLHQRSEAGGSSDGNGSDGGSNAATAMTRSRPKDV
jgi:hypothetical protein